MSDFQAFALSSLCSRQMRMSTRPWQGRNKRNDEHPHPCFSARVHFRQDASTSGGRGRHQPQRGRLSSSRHLSKHRSWSHVFQCSTRPGRNAHCARKRRVRVYTSRYRMVPARRQHQSDPEAYPPIVKPVSPGDDSFFRDSGDVL